METEDFCSKYHVRYNTVYMMYKNNVIPKHVISNGINEDYFIRRKEFKQKITNEAHQLYYYLHKYFSDVTLTIILSRITGHSQYAWNTFLTYDLFSRDSDDITKFKIKGKLWLFYRVSRNITRYCFNKFGLKYEPKKIEYLILKD